MINLMDSKVWTEVSYKKEKGNYYAVVRFLDRNKEPFAQIPITYALNPKGYRFTETRIGMDRNGEVKIKVDTSDHVLRLGFYEGKPLLEDNILSNLLLTSYLKGYIKDPTYYFNDTTTILEHHLELVMQTHGWTRFDPGKIARGEFPKEKYEIEVGQIISGKVKNFWGKDVKGAGITLLSNYGVSRLTGTDEQGKFVIDDLLFNDNTLFLYKH